LKGMYDVRKRGRVKSCVPVILHSYYYYLHNQKEFLMAPPPKNSINIRTLTLTLTLYDQNHMLIIKYTNSIDS